MAILKSFKFAPVDNAYDESNIEKALSQNGSKPFFELGRQLNQTTKLKDRQLLFNFLNLARSNALLKQIYAENKQNEWFDLCLKIIKKSNFTLGHLFYQRVVQYNSKPLFKEIKKKAVRDYSWLDIKKKVYAIARGLLSLASKTGSGTVAILSENSLEMACLDIACLITGTVNVPIAANSLPESVSYVLKHSEAKTLFISTDKQLKKVLSAHKQLKNLQNIVVIARSVNIINQTYVIAFAEFLKQGKGLSEAELKTSIEKVKLKDLATIMYTSGTTKAPKGIMFSHLNIISKRFARAMALPEIGPQDTFLCYLPLYHTFGRYFEMLGCLFWGSTYAFMSGTKIATIIENMQSVKPTVFISIPQKWIQLYDKIQETVDIYTAPSSEIHSVLDALTGGQLKWGLSAAGYLDAEIFQFFQRYGVELMSGFGMTEATGGITMTPPVQYRANSVGTALPGIDIQLEKDGEMKTRGPYMMMGYLKDESAQIQDGWFHTGDIFTRDADGFYQIIDRKKEIYKNVKGQTISPQKIENLFKEFESIQSVFLVGDHRENNTLLLYPNYEYEPVKLKKLNQSKLREFFSSMIVSVNRFLTPFERIVNFEIIDRDFDADKGELTPKGSYKRKGIEKNFSEIIENMYGARYIALDIQRYQLRIPKWFLREKGLTANDLKLSRTSLYLHPHQTCLRIKPSGQKRGQVQVGSFVYKMPGKYLDLGEFVRKPSLWVGNVELEKFVGENVLQRSLMTESDTATIEVLPAMKTRKEDKKLCQELSALDKDKVYNLRGAHIATYLAYTSNWDRARSAIDYLASVLEEQSDPISGIASTSLIQISNHPNKTLKRYAFETLLSWDKHYSARDLFEAFVSKDNSLLDRKTNKRISDRELGNVQVRSAFAFLKSLARQLQGKNKARIRQTMTSVIDLLTTYGTRHPIAYKSIRAEFVALSLIHPDRQLRSRVKAATDALLRGFRKWLGQNQRIAVDAKTAREFRWRDVITCEEGLDPQDERTIVTAIKNYPLIREAIFLFTGKTLVRLEHISLKGIWISYLGAMHAKTVYRVSVQTRDFGSFDLAVNLNKNLSEKDIATEISWLICAGVKKNTPPLVEDFGGYWPEFDLWTEEFIPGENVDSHLKRLARKTDSASIIRMQNLWPHFVWSASKAYIEFWNRTGRRLEIADPTPANIIVPFSDFQVGSRIVSISDRKLFEGIPNMLLSFWDNFVEALEQQYPKLSGHADWFILFSSVVDILGEQEALQILESSANLLKSIKSDKKRAEMLRQLKKFINDVKEKGHLSKRLYFAIKRFNRWHALNKKATQQAQLQTLHELMTTYTIDDLQKTHPGSRIQLFRDTVFAGNDNIRNGLNRLIRGLRSERITDELLDFISELKAKIPFSEEEDFFLTRMTFPHLGPEDSAQLITLPKQGMPSTDLLVFFEDQQGNQLGIRQPATPKEIAQLHGLYTMANLAIEFRPEHQYLIVLNDRLHVVGGIFYRFVEPGHVHLEKIVVERRYRKKGVSNGLMQDFFNRLKNQDVKIVTVGFLRPEFFYKYGFRIEHRYGNMVKRLKEDDAQIP